MRERVLVAMQHETMSAELVVASILRAPTLSVEAASLVNRTISDARLDVLPMQLLMLTQVDQIPPPDLSEPSGLSACARCQWGGTLGLMWASIPFDAKLTMKVQIDRRPTLGCVSLNSRETARIPTAVFFAGNQPVLQLLKWLPLDSFKKWDWLDRERSGCTTKYCLHLIPRLRRVGACTILLKRPCQ